MTFNITNVNIVYDGDTPSVARVQFDFHNEHRSEISLNGFIVIDYAEYENNQEIEQLKTLVKSFVVGKLGGAE